MLSAVALFIIAVLLAGLGTAVGSKAAEIPSGAWQSYKDYQTKAHHRAFACTRRQPRGGWACSWSWAHLTVESAIEMAVGNCEKRRSGTKIRYECKLQAIGDIEVSGMNEEQLDRAISFYKNNLNATNEDLAKGRATPTGPTFDLLISDEKRFVGTKVRPGSETNSFTMGEGNIAFFFMKVSNIKPGDFRTWDWKFYTPTGEIYLDSPRSGRTMSQSRWNFWETLYLDSPRIQPGFWKVEFEFDERVVEKRTFEILAAGG